MKPLILIFCSVDDNGVTELKPKYASSVIRAGGIPLCAPYTTNLSVIEEYAKMFDGFIFSGGKDIDPSRYGEEFLNDTISVQKLRDEFELNALKILYKTNKPILGICRGAQLINVYLGGTLYQDIPSQIETNITHRQVEPKNSFSHSITVDEDSPLYNLAKASTKKVNSFHHQSVKSVGKDLKVMATSNDGVIEALYSKTHKYLRLYQWHPELLCDFDDLSLNIFIDFINNCKI